MKWVLYVFPPPVLPESRVEKTKEHVISHYQNSHNIPRMDRLFRPLPQVVVNYLEKVADTILVRRVSSTLSGWNLRAKPSSQIIHDSHLTRLARYSL